VSVIKRILMMMMTIPDVGFIGVGCRVPSLGSRGFQTSLFSVFQTNVIIINN